MKIRQEHGKARALTLLAIALSIAGVSWLAITLLDETPQSGGKENAFETETSSGDAPPTAPRDAPPRLPSVAYDPVAAGEALEKREPCDDALAVEILWSDGRPLTRGKVLLWQGDRELEQARLAEEKGIVRFSPVEGEVDLGITGHGRGIWCAKTSGRPGWRRWVLPRTSALELDVQVNGEPARQGTRIKLTPAKSFHTLPIATEGVRATGLHDLRFRAGRDLEELPASVRMRIQREGKENPGWLHTDALGRLLVPGYAEPTGLALSLPRGFTVTGRDHPHSWFGGVQHEVLEDVINGTRLSLSRGPALVGTLIHGRGQKPLKWASLRLVDQDGISLSLDERCRTDEVGSFQLVLGTTNQPRENVWLVAHSFTLGYHVERLAHVPAEGADLGRITCLRMGSLRCRITTEEGKAVRRVRVKPLPWGPTRRRARDESGFIVVPMPEGVSGLRYRFSGKGIVTQEIPLPEPVPEVWDISLRSGAKIVLKFAGKAEELDPQVLAHVSPVQMFPRRGWTRPPQFLGLSHDKTMIFADIPCHEPVRVRAFQDGNCFFERVVQLSPGQRELLEVSSPPVLRGIVSGRILTSDGRGASRSHVWVGRADQALPMDAMRTLAEPGVQADSHGFWNNPLIESARTDKDGRFKLRVSSAKKWRVHAFHPRLGFAMREVELRTNQATADLILEPVRWSRIHLLMSHGSDLRCRIHGVRDGPWELSMGFASGPILLPRRKCQFEILAAGGSHRMQIAAHAQDTLFKFPERGWVKIRGPGSKDLENGIFVAARTGTSMPVQIWGGHVASLLPGDYAIYGDPQCWTDLGIEFTIHAGQETVVTLP